MFVARKAAGAVACAILLSIPALAKDKTVTVDCSKGESINAALASNEPPLVIEFSGICTEGMQIQRDDVTLRGISPDAAIIGASAGPAVKLYGVHRIVLTGFAVSDPDGVGINVTASSGVVVDSVSVSHAFYGLLLLYNSEALVRNSTFNENRSWGIGVFDNSSIRFEGTVATNSNVEIGFVLSASTATFSARGASLVSNGNQEGYFLQLGAQALMATGRPSASISAAGNTDCALALVAQSSWWSGAMSISDGPCGVWVEQSSLEVTDLSITGCGLALYLGMDSAAVLRAPHITGNGEGVYLDSAQAYFGRAVIAGNTSYDVFASFGTHATFEGVTTVENVACDGTVLVRGSVTCPPAITSRMTTNAAATTVREHIAPTLLLP